MTAETFSPQETLTLGQRLGENASPGDIITLYGDLGCGKTVIAQGIAIGLGIEEPVNSPTFTIMQIYEGGRLPLYHFDVYRIDDISEMDEVGYEDFFYREGVSVIEWADMIEDLLPEDHIRVEMLKDPEKGFDYRKIKITRKREAAGDEDTGA